MIGYIDVLIGQRSIRGWAMDRDGDPIFVMCYKKDKLIGVSRPQFFRSDLGGIGDGKHGFTIECSQDVKIEEIVDGSVFVVSSNLSNKSIRLSLVPGFEYSGQVSLVRNSLNEASHSAVIQALTDFNSPRHGQISELSSLLMNIGFQSIDHSCVLGREGFIFLVAGSNSVNDLYNKDAESKFVQSISQEWESLFQIRNINALENGISYYQMIIPEKQSVIGHLLPTPSIQATPLLHVIENIMIDDKSKIYYLSILDLFNENNGLSAYRKVDSHLTPSGAWAIVRALLERLGSDNGLHVEISGTTVATGDLAARMLGTKLLDEYALYTLYHAAHGADEKEVADPLLIFSFDPPGGAHKGTVRHFRAEFPVVDKKVMVFGNSFCAWGHTQCEITWWLARIFKELYFVWEPAIDWEKVRQFNPDVVIGQTIERFLPKVPAS